MKMKEKIIYTIGYGNREIKDFFDLLKKYDIEFLIDVRSFPYSKLKHFYSKPSLEGLSKKNNVQYVFWGKSLGGKPDNEELYFDDGRVNYKKIQEQDYYQKSIERLIDGYNQGFKLALMCSELKPEECHRSKLIGESLIEKDIKVQHIDSNGNLKGQNEVILRVTKGMNTKDLFGDITLSSTGIYSPVNKIDMDFYTIGVYNSTEDSFFRKLKDNSVDTFIDIRQRRGVRGAKYAFVNSNRLQEKLNQLKINYVYFQSLAPTKEIRDLQKQADLRAGIEKRNREYLGQTFISEYKLRVLNEFDFSIFFETLKKIHSKKIVLFCVEEKHTACHRSIVAKRLYEEFNYHVRHL
jgi:uncharacterized protein (DUF488 family)